MADPLGLSSIPETNDRRRRAFDATLDAFERMMAGDPRAASFSEAARVSYGGFHGQGYFSLSKSTVEELGDAARIERFNALRDRALTTGIGQHRLPRRMQLPTEGRRLTPRERRREERENRPAAAASPPPVSASPLLVDPRATSADVVSALVGSQRKIRAPGSERAAVTDARRTIAAADRVLAAVEGLALPDARTILEGALALLAKGTP